MLLFDLVVPENRAGADFLAIRSASPHAPARALMERVFEEWPYAKREFVTDFQTHGFSARVWELALFGYLAERGYSFDATGTAPDFVVSKDGTTVAIEATTTNPRRDGVSDGATIEREELPHIPKDVAASQEEFVFQLAKALRRKLRLEDEERAYWEDPRLSGVPFVIALEAFHGDTALYHGDATLTTYLYGVDAAVSRDDAGQSRVVPVRVDEHRRREQVIPSGFFFQPGTEQVSAVIFSNAATLSQFQRMGIEHGYTAPVTVVRFGTCYDPDPDAFEPQEFSYVVEAGVHRESFAQGMRVMHNPRALNPVPDEFFTDVTQMILRDDGLVASRHPPFVPFASVTYILPNPDPGPPEKAT